VTRTFGLQIGRLISAQAQLEKQVKELNVRIVDLETRSYANSPRPATISRRVDGRIEELTNQLNQNNRDRNALGRSAEKLAKDVKFQQSELERQRAKFEEEKKEYEARIQDLRNALDMVVCLWVFQKYDVILMP